MARDPNGLTSSDSKNYCWSKQQCPICEVEPTRFVGRRGGSAHRAGLGIETYIWKCGNCGLLFPNPMPFPKGGLGQHYDVEAEDYFSAHDKNEKIQSATRLMIEAESILGRTGKLLDVGVGRGETLLVAQNRGWLVEGVEPSGTFADCAEQRTGAKIWRQPIEESEIERNHYDVVILSAVLEHLYNPDQIIQKISGALVKGGLLYVDVPNESGLYFKVGNIYQKLRGRDWCVNLAPTFSPFHVFGFSQKALRSLLSKHGLTPEVWRVYAGTSLVPHTGGIVATSESLVSKAITAISNIGTMGTYIEAWAKKH